MLSNNQTLSKAIPGLFYSAAVKDRAEKAVLRICSFPPIQFLDTGTDQKVTAIGSKPAALVQFAPSISSAMASILVTLFRLRAVPGVFSSFSTADHGSFEFPTPLRK